ncbi:MAG: GNAT family N-acetyltransferase [Cephaloticoccus sp.]|nr:GNAT family N-acetyltransferase [Cephaloticoccus sp.]MCF7759777.1 GNAT family N-acetyltransferase [Cephaloticoccus sp.]
MNVLRAKPTDAETLSRIARSAKAHWGYPESWLQQWQVELTITPEAIKAHPTFIATDAGRIIGVCMLKLAESTASIEHMWVLPDAMGRGVGRALFVQAEIEARSSGAVNLCIISDPHAEEFYIRMGAKIVGHLPARMDQTERFLTLLEKPLV